MIFTTKNTDETRAIGRKIAEKLHTGGTETAYIAMRGEMGVGKTAFVSGFASYFGISGVKSPTYAVMNQYSMDGITIRHFDMYRITDEDDLYSIGYDDYVNARGYNIVEWSENIEYAIPDSAIYVSIERLPECDEHRRITVTGGGMEIQI
ncbi:MAG: tRNA (adenosine(37)-N6)-threonylcarbamoyltransferase complex ATPase subunit type 1 TsaE [Clostridia bacterium]|nr:tRNA (adenosine(37)-N6)-threonylcarbamoyltransferase complex ATPase subunit type 1 TsaE [Clostridia bacterium]